MDETPSPIERAISAAGSQAKLAEKIGCSQQLVSYWKSKGRVPADVVPAIEAATGISRHELRADIFGAAA